jgi:tetratricopeptide (TPR) repeat protein
VQRIPTYPGEVRLIGRCFSHYRVVRLLSEQGNMGSVYEAEDTTLLRRVAIKVIDPPLGEGAGAVDRYLREARAMSRVEHQNVVAIHDVLTQDGLQLLVMQYVDGTSLRQRLKDGPFTVDEALRVAFQVASGLQEAHRHGVVHRDMKPENVVMTREGQCKVLDFGIAHLVDLTTSHDSGALVGTVPYMAPEQVRGERADARSDLYSLGIMLYEMLAGRLPWTAHETAPLLYEILEAPIPDLRSLRSEVGGDVARIVAHAMSRDPGRRYQDAAELLHDLEVVRRGTGTLVAPPIVDRRLRLLLAAGVTAAVVGAVVAVLFGLGILPPRPTGAVPRLMVAGWEMATPDSSVRWLQSGVPDYLIRALAGQPGVRVISRETARSAILAVTPDGTGSSNADVARAARRLEAGFLVSGTIEPHGDRVLLLCGLTNVRDGTLVKSWSREVVSMDQGFYPAMEFFASVITDILRLGDERPWKRAPRARDALTPSMAALRAYHEALQQNEAGDVPGATSALRLAVAADPGFADAQLLLSRISVDGEERGRAMAAAQAASGRASASTRGLIEGDALLVRGHVAEAAQAYRAVLDRDPENVVAATSLAEAYTSQRRFREASAVFATLHDVDPFDYGFYRDWAWACTQVGREDLGLALLQQWRVALPREQAPLRALAETRRALGDYERGLMICDTLDGLHAGASTMPRAQMLTELGRLHEARGLFERMRASPDAYAAASRGASFLAVIDLMDREHANGLRLMEEPLRRDPGPFNWWLAGLLAAGDRRFGTARAFADSIAREMTDADSTGPHAFTDHRFLFHLRGCIAMAEDSARVAVGLLERALENTSRSDRPFFVTDAARAHLAAGDASNAVRELEDPDALNPRYPPAMLELGRAYVQLGRGADARRVLIELSRIWSRADPDYVLKQELDVLLRSGETRQARGGH